MNSELALTPKQIEAKIIHCVRRKKVPLITSAPGVGKSSIVHKVADTFGLKLLDLRLSQCTPEDLQGYPMRNGSKAEFVPFSIFPLEGEEMPEGINGWLLFLDEITSANKAVQAAAYKLILDRMVGSYKLHPNVVIVAAGNRMQDNAVVVKMSSALRSRMIHLSMAVDHADWLDWAVSTGKDYRVTGFINFRPSKLMDFDPEKDNDTTFSCPRTLEFLSDLVEGCTVDDEDLPLLAGTVGEGTATEFITYCKEYDRLPRYEDILKDPSGLALPAESSTKYAAVSMLAERFEPQDLDKLLEYVKRFALELQIVFCRMAVRAKPEARYNHPGFGQYLSSMIRYIQS